MAGRALRNVLTVATACGLELYRRRDVYVSLLLAAVIVVPLASVNVFGVEGAVRYVREVMLLLVWAFSLVIGVTTAARQVPAELEHRTIYPLLARPLSRGEFILGKYLGAWAATAASVLVFYGCFVVLGALKEGQGFPAVLPQAVLLHLGFAAVVTAMALFGSVVLTPSANIACCLLIAAGMLLFGESLAGFASRAPAPANWIGWAAHAVAPHVEFFDLRLRLVHGWEPLPWGVLCGVLLYAILYSAALLGAAVWVFRRKPL